MMRTPVMANPARKGQLRFHSLLKNTGHGSNFLISLFFLALLLNKEDGCRPSFYRAMGLEHVRSTCKARPVIFLFQFYVYSFTNFYKPFSQLWCFLNQKKNREKYKYWNIDRTLTKYSRWDFNSIPPVVTFCLMNMQLELICELNLIKVKINSCEIIVFCQNGNRVFSNTKSFTMTWFKSYHTFILSFIYSSVIIFISLF